MNLSFPIVDDFQNSATLHHRWLASVPALQRTFVPEEDSVEPRLFFQANAGRIHLV